MTKNTVKVTIAILIALTIALYFISGTYANYTNTANGQGSVQIAKWAVKVGNEAISKSFDTTFTVEGNQNVVSGRIAPGLTAKATIIVDLDGTEVATKITAKLGSSADLASKFGDGTTATIDIAANDENGATVQSLGSGLGAVAKLPEGAAFDSTNGKVKVTISIPWDGESNETDTEKGKVGDTVTLPVDLTVEQYTA